MVKTKLLWEKLLQKAELLRKLGYHEEADDLVETVQALRGHYNRYPVPDTGIIQNLPVNVANRIYKTLTTKPRQAINQFTVAVGYLLAKHGNGLDVKTVAEVLKIPPSRVQMPLRTYKTLEIRDGKIYTDETTLQRLKEIVEEAGI